MRSLIKGEIEKFIGFREILGENFKKGVKGKKRGYTLIPDIIEGIIQKKKDYFLQKKF